MPNAVGATWYMVFAVFVWVQQKTSHSFAVEKQSLSLQLNPHLKQHIMEASNKKQTAQKTTHQSSCELSETGSSTFTIQSIIMSQGQLQHQASQKPIKKCLSYLWRLHIRSHLLSVCVQAPHPPPRLFSHAGPTILHFSLGYGRWRIQGIQGISTRALRSWNCVIWN